MVTAWKALTDMLRAPKCTYVCMYVQVYVLYKCMYVQVYVLCKHACWADLQCIERRPFAGSLAADVFGVVTMV